VSSLAAACERGNRLDPRVARALSLIDERFADPKLSLKQLSRELAVSEDRLGDLLKQQLGTPFRPYLRNFRIRKAAALFLSASNQIKDIAAAVGYASPSHFGADFRQCMGVSPTEFRRRAQSGEMEGTKSVEISTHTEFLRMNAGNLRVISL
jgi:AraC-like DNA-binding protein